MNIMDLHDADKTIYLALSSARRLKENNIALIKEIEEEGFDLILLTSNQPAPYLMDLYEKNGIDLSKIKFIDVITKYALGRVPEGLDQVKFINNPGDLTDITIAITQILADNGGNTFIFIDSVNAMLIYIPSANMSKFVHFLSSKLRLLDIRGMFLAVEKGLDPILMGQLTAFTDEVIDLDRDGE
ncbi:MAG: hypothetical protein U9N40_05395 [Euryarchaeota archaeon]|nr:hypothetical protein [Euryarchaeota archaeon]